MVCMCSILWHLRLGIQLTQYYVRNVKHQVKVAACHLNSGLQQRAKGLSGERKLGVLQYVVAVKIKEKNILYFI